MDPLAAHLERLSWEKQKALRDSGVGPASYGPVPSPERSPSPASNNCGTRVLVDQYWVPLEALDGETASHPCVNSLTGQQLSCRVYDAKVFQSKIELYLANISGVHWVKEVITVGRRVFVFSEQTYEDLHQYLREKKKLSEVQAAPLFRQIVELVKDAHSKNIALRDIKLKKFVFEDANRKKLSLQHLDDAQAMPTSGQLADRHGCPAYVCPEMLQLGSYSGQAADAWSLGVILYTLLVGHYPFFDSSPIQLFSKVRSGYYQVPDHVSELARSLISSLLAYDPSSRVPAWAILEHPWFRHAADASFTPVVPSPPIPPHLLSKDQTVPHMK